MKKVGLLTFHRSYNDGSLLQAYALQKVLTSHYKLENEFVNFSNEGQRQLYSTFAKPKKVVHFFRNMLYVVIAPVLKKQKKDFENFISSHLTVSSGDYKTNAELMSIEKNYDGFIVGSDQIWNTNCADADDAYFLNFTNNHKKYAYAVSFGANNISGHGSEVEDKYRKLMNEFDIISVREANAVRWVKELTGKDVKLVADPTLLIARSDYDLLAKKRYIAEKYIFYYSFGYDSYASEIVYKYAKEKGLPVYVLDAKQWLRKKLFLYDFKLVDHNGPEVFLSLIRDAEYVFTTSLHGTAFSTIYEKSFWYLTNKTENELAGNDDDRAVSMLNQLGLIDRFVTKYDLEKKGIDYKIDYKSVRQKKDKIVKESFAVLDEIVGSLTRFEL